MQNDSELAIYEALKSEIEEGDGHAPAYYIFSDTGNANYGRKLANYIQRNKLGTTITTRVKRNPNTNNKVTVWLWSINRQRTTTLFNKRFKAEHGYYPNKDY